MADDGTSFQIDLGVQGGAAIDAAAASLDTLQSRLVAAGDASTVAARAVEEGEAAYRQAETSADRAAKALERIGIAADAQRGKLQDALDVGDLKGADAAQAKLDNLMQRQAEAAAKAAQASSALNDEAAALDALKASAAAAAANEEQLTSQMQEETDAAAANASAHEDASEAAGGSAVNMRVLSGALGHLGGPLGNAGQQIFALGGGLQRLSSQLGDAGPYVAAAVLFVAITTAAIAATIAIAKWGIEQADAARTSALLSDGIAGTVAGGRQLDATFDALATKVPQSREELSSMASQLAATGLRGDALSAALETAAVKAAKLKYGPDFAKQTLSLSNQTARFHSLLGALFSGLKIEDFLQGMSSVIGLFDQTTASGKAIKVVFESLFQPVVDGATAMLPKVGAAFLQLEIWALKALIALKPYGSQIVMVGEAMAALAAIVVIAAGIVIGVMALVFAAFVAVAYAVINVVTQFENLYGQVQTSVAAIGDISLSDIGTNMIDGLVGGLEAAGGKVLASLTGIVGDAVDAAKKKLGIASPSKVMQEEIGEQMGAGAAQGIDGAAADVQDSLTAMVAPPALESMGAPAAPASAPASGGASSGDTYNITVNASGGDGQGIAEQVIAAIRTLRQGNAVQTGREAPAT